MITQRNLALENSLKFVVVTKIYRAILLEILINFKILIIIIGFVLNKS